MGAETNQDNITVAFIDNAAVIRVEGKACFKNSPPMKQFIYRVIDEDLSKRILIDMLDCTGMDSTFMGVLAGISCHIKSKPEMKFKLINLSQKNKKLLTTLGVDRVVNYSLTSTDEENNLIHQDPDETHALDPDFSNKLDSAKTTLEAHETLVNINPENFSKFKSVLEFLKDDVDALSND